MDRYRTFWRRFWAGWIDALVLFPLNWVDELVGNFGLSAIGLGWWSLFSYSLGAAYSVGMHARYGQTLGKMVMRVKVLDASETRLPSIRQAVLRDVLYIAIASLVLVDLLYVMTNGVHVEATAHGAAIERAITWGSFAWFSVEILTMLSNVKRRALHDFIASTVVIRTAV